MQQGTIINVLTIVYTARLTFFRYLMITQPMVYPKRRTGKLMVVLIATAWLLSCLIIIPALFGFTQNVKDGKRDAILILLETILNSLKSCCIHISLLVHNVPRNLSI